MTNEQKVAQMSEMLGEEIDTCILSVYLSQAKQLILNKRFPFGEQPKEVEPKLEQLQIELAITLFNERGVEGQSSHNENGVQRTYRTKSQIMAEVVPFAGVL